MGFGALMCSMNFASDIQMPTLFLFKALLQPITFVGLVISILCATMFRSKTMMAAVIVSLTINVPFLLPNISKSSEPQKTKDSVHSISVATFSTLTRTDNISDIADFITSENPDVFCLQEVSAQHRQRLLNNLNGHYAHSIENNNNQLTLSHYPIKVVKDEGQFIALQLIEDRLGAIEIVNAHMPRPYRSTGIDSVWSSLFEHLDIAKRTILCGDLNITPNNTLYDVLRFKHGLQDSILSGYGFTYPNAQRRSALFGPLIRIDYILTRGFTALETRTINASPLSDHRAVITHLTSKQSATNE